MKMYFKLAIACILFSLFQSCGVKNVAQEKKDDTIKFLALGDSYTIGEMVLENERWPMQLVNEFLKTDQVIEKPIIIAKTGWRSDELLNAMNQSQLKKEFDLVSIQIGVNNQYQNKSSEDFIIDFRQILEHASDYGKFGLKSVFVVSIPNYGLTPLGKTLKKKKIGSELKTYNFLIKKVCEEMNIPFVDISEAANQVKTDRALVADDKLHPSGKQYKSWIKFIYPFAESIIAANSTNK